MLEHVDSYAYFTVHLFIIQRGYVSTSPTPKHILDLVITLCKSTGNYVAKRIYDEDERNAYINGMNAAMGIILGYKGGTAASAGVRALVHDSEKIYKRRFLFSREREKARYCQALSHAIEITDKLQARFVDGTSDDVPKVYKNSEYLYDEPDYFK